VTPFFPIGQNGKQVFLALIGTSFVSIVLEIHVLQKEFIHKKGNGQIMQTDHLIRTRLQLAISTMYE
jgi:hypothetical protein